MGSISTRRGLAAGAHLDRLAASRFFSRRSIKYCSMLTPVIPRNVRRFAAATEAGSGGLGEAEPLKHHQRRSHDRRAVNEPGRRERQDQEGNGWGSSAGCVDPAGAGCTECLVMLVNLLASSPIRAKGPIGEAGDPWMFLGACCLFERRGEGGQDVGRPCRRRSGPALRGAILRLTAHRRPLGVIPTKAQRNDEQHRSELFTTTELEQHCSEAGPPQEDKKDMIVRIERQRSARTFCGVCCAATRSLRFA
jgi:hypothetical protein